MYNNVYQEYINNMLGTLPKRQSELEFETNTNFSYFQNPNANINMQLEQFYPESYKLLYPMIQTACMRNTKPITKEIIDEMVEEIYSNFTTEDTAKEHQTNFNNKSASKSGSENKQREVSETRVVRPNNFILNDLIRILLIRELLGRPGNFPPNRPGFPPRPGPGGRPPFRPRDFEFNSQDLGIYEEPYNFNF